jgi:tryptophan halogenase
MEIPPELQANIDLFRDSGRFFRNGNEMFAEISWIQVMIGQGILPQAYHPLVDQVSEQDLQKFIASIGRTISDCVDVMPAHQAFIDRYCAAAPPLAALPIGSHKSRRYSATKNENGYNGSLVK